MGKQLEKLPQKKTYLNINKKKRRRETNERKCCLWYGEARAAYGYSVYLFMAQNSAQT